MSLSDWKQEVGARASDAGEQRLHRTDDFALRVDILQEALC